MLQCIILAESLANSISGCVGRRELGLVPFDRAWRGAQKRYTVYAFDCLKEGVKRGLETCPPRCSIGKTCFKKISMKEEGERDESVCAGFGGSICPDVF